jgi:hypothetical protein
MEVGLLLIGGGLLIAVAVAVVLWSVMSNSKR